MVKMSEKIIRYDLETEIDHGIEVSNLAYATAKELGLAENLCYEPVSYTHLPYGKCVGRCKTYRHL